MDIKNEYIDRREFIGRAAKVAAAATTIGIFNPFAPSRAANGKKLKVALVGTGKRGTGMWGSKLIQHFENYVEMVALCDINPKRLKVAQRMMNINADLYLANEFDKMITDKKPDSVIITTPDCFHVHYAIRAMNLGCDVIVEKPLATEAEQCQMLLDAENKTGKTVTTTFNARHGNSAVEIKKFIKSGELGRIISTEFHEYLDIYHGASYFRRWHGKSNFSGTLLVHKASHHFDQVNWWLDSDPVEVHAYGKTDFYGANNSFRGRNCRNCTHTNDCQFYWDIMQDKQYKELYVDCEDADGYLRDGCVWDKRNDTYDSMTAEVTYKNGVILCYTLNAFMPYEGQTIAFNGTNGRLDIRNYHNQPWEPDNISEFRYTKIFDKTRTWAPKPGSGEHGGADMKIKKLMFEPDKPDPLGQLAGSRAGIMSSLIGIAARKSIESGKRIKIDDLIDFPMRWKW